MKIRELRPLVLVAAALLGCEVAVVDLGSNHPDTGGGARSSGGAGGAGSGGSESDAGHDTGNGGSTGPVTTADCPALTEAEAEVLYGHPCTNAICTQLLGVAHTIGSGAELVAVLQTQWRTCNGNVPWPAAVVGLEFQPGCTIFLLHATPDGGVARGVLPEDQGTFNVIETKLGDAVTRSLVLYFPTFTWAVSATTSDCPHHLRFTEADGGTIEFAAISGAPGPQ